MQISRVVSSISDVRLVEPRFFRRLVGANAFQALVLLALLFPYIRFYPNANDVQAHVSLLAIVAGGILLLQNRPVINWLFVPAIAAPLIGLAYGDPLAEVARATAIYAGVAFSYVFTAHAIERGFPLISLFKLVFFANLFVGAWQLTIDPWAFEFLTPVRSSADRGITGLAVEPSFYGLAVAITTLTIVVFATSVREKTLYAGLGALQVFAFSQSSLAIIFSMGCLILYMLALGRPLRTAVILSLLLALAVVSFLILMPSSSRAYQVIQGLLTNPWAVIAEDVSVALRVSHVLVSNMGAAFALFLPQGFSSFADHIRALTNWPIYIEETNRIMSGYGSAVFELGFFALPMLLYNFRVAFVERSKLGASRLKLTALAFALFFMFQNAISFALPLYAIILAVLNHSSTLANNEVK